MTRLKSMIEENGITQKKLAEELGFPPQTFNNYVRGSREMDYFSISKVCDYFHCTSDYLLGRSDVPYSAVSDEDARILRMYHALPLAIRQAVDGLMAPYEEIAEEKKSAV